MTEATPSITKSMEAEHGASRMRINPMGARIEELQLGGVPLMLSVRRGDGKEASTHPCTPNFGPTELYDLAQHGPMRNAQCYVRKESPSEVVLGYDIKERLYPNRVSVLQTFSVYDNAFTLITVHLNNGEKIAPVNFGEHFYLNAPQGWEGLSINGQDVTDMVKADGVIPLLEQNEIAIPGLPKIILEQQGFDCANLWVYKDPASGEYDRHYVCIEPVEKDPYKYPFGSEAGVIKPGRGRVATLTIRIDRP